MFNTHTHTHTNRSTQKKPAKRFLHSIPRFVWQHLSLSFWSKKLLDSRSSTWSSHCSNILGAFCKKVLFKYVPLDTCEKDINNHLCCCFLGFFNEVATLPLSNSKYDPPLFFKFKLLAIWHAFCYNLR